MIQMDDYTVFKDMGLFSETGIPIGFKKIRVHLVFAVKHDGRHKSRLVADGNLTDIPLESVYAGVVSIRGLRMCILISELNDMEAYATLIRKHTLLILEMPILRPRPRKSLYQGWTRIR